MRSNQQRSLRRQDFPQCVVFVERDGIYWLKKGEACLARRTPEVTYTSDEVGLDRLEAFAHAQALIRLGMRVGIRRGDTLRMVRPPLLRTSNPVPTTAIFLAPELLLEQRELAQAQKGLSSKFCKYRPSFEYWHAVLAEEALTPSDWPTIYVYELPGGLYEIDWQMTSFSESSFRGLALACHLIGRKLACRLTVPQHAVSKRRAKRNEGGSTLVTYGQMRLAL